jgi:hypothetical protein
MAEKNCFLCKKKCSEYTFRYETPNKVEYYCSLECCVTLIRIEKLTKGHNFIVKETRAFTNLRDSIKNQPDGWKMILPFVYGWLMFYLALKRRDTRSRLKHLFDLAVRKNQEVFSEIDGDKVFKETNPAVLLVLTKYLIKHTQELTEELIDLFATTDSESETT